jgi:phospholipid-binding lipoprotein MlaA
VQGFNVLRVFSWLFTRIRAHENAPLGSGCRMKKLLIIVLAIAYPVTGFSLNLGAHAAEATKTEAAGTAPDNAEELFQFDEPEYTVSDPLEPLNRGIFWFNDKLYFYLFKPVARAYRWAMPEPWQVAAKNVFSNLASPIRIINSGVQGKFADAGNELSRFFINTTLGIGGLFDTARDNFNIRKHDEDTGQSLGHYGIGPGFYLVLPVLGPSDVRDAVGTFVDSRMDLVYYLFHGWTYWEVKGYEKINDLALDKDTYESIKKEALDPYLFIRDAYMQYRQNKVRH